MRAWTLNVKWRWKLRGEWEKEGQEKVVNGEMGGGILVQYSKSYTLLIKKT